MVFESNEKPPSPEDGRSSKLKATMDLALRLAATNTGRTIEDIQNTYEVSRRTAERMRDLVEAMFGELERNQDGRQVRFRLPLPKGLNFITAPTAGELAELMNLTEAMKGRDPARAGILDSLSRKIEAAMRQSDRVRLDPDIEVQRSTEVWAHTPGPAQVCEPEVLKTVRHALLTSRALEVRYRRVGDETPRVYRLIPYGLILGLGTCH
jgi:predicted DNA-binding transcriptional regulator YafY